MAEEYPYIEMPLREIRKRLSELGKNRNDVIIEMKKMNIYPYGTEIPSSNDRYTYLLKTYNNEIEEIREWYMIRMLESLDTSSNRLNKLTMWLIALTAVLTIISIIQVCKLF